MAKLKNIYNKTLAERIVEKHAGKEVVINSGWLSVNPTKAVIERLCKCGCGYVLCSLETETRTHQEHIKPSYIQLEKPENFLRLMNELVEMLNKRQCVSKEELSKLIIRCDELLYNVEDFLSKEDIIVFNKIIRVGGKAALHMDKTNA